jgi:plastocyanin
MPRIVLKSHSRSGNRRRRAASYAVMFLGAAVLLSGCDWPQGFARGTENRYVIEMVDDSRSSHRYSPSSLTIPVGSTVVWRNEGRGPHTATLQEAEEIETTSPPPGGSDFIFVAEDGEWDSGDLYPGVMWSRTFDEPGDYLFACRRHGDQGMVAAITVWDPEEE